MGVFDGCPLALEGQLGFEDQGQFVIDINDELALPTSRSRTLKTVGSCRRTFSRSRDVGREVLSMATAEWKRLRIGDKIRFVALPTGYSRHNCHRDTLRAYRTLIERRRPVRIHHLDELKMPWVHFRVRRSDGTWDHHYLLINHDGWVRIRSRKAKT